MSHPVLRPTINNIINLWFGEDTPIRRYKARMNPALWQACEQTSRHGFLVPGEPSVNRYRRADRVQFAKAVQAALGHVHSQALLLGEFTRLSDS